jgi:alcohol dehydrogenase
MRGAAYSSFGGRIGIADLPEPVSSREDAVIEVRASGVCRSDWHGWQGHDPDITVLPHVPGHEFAGVVVDVGESVTRWSAGDRVATPFISGCGRCEHCIAGRSQVCPDQTQPGFTHWGSFAERVVVRQADFNLLRLPDTVSFEAGASLGCRFSTAYRAVVDQGRARSDEWVAIYGCGGVGLSAIMIAAALGARPVGIDPGSQARELAVAAGAEVVWEPDEARDRLPHIDGGGPHVTIDAIGAPSVVADAVAGLRRQGRHVQVGLLPGAGAFEGVVASRVISHELSIVGSHGISVTGLEEVLRLTAAGRLHPDRLIRRRVDLAGGVDVLTNLDADPALGITVITAF